MALFIDLRFWALHCTMAKQILQSHVNVVVDGFDDSDYSMLACNSCDAGLPSPVLTPVLADLPFWRRTAHPQPFCCGSYEGARYRLRLSADAANVTMRKAAPFRPLLCRTGTV